jgi:hypothetical protein
MGNPEPESFIFDREIVGSGHNHDSIKKNVKCILKPEKRGGQD